MLESTPRSTTLIMRTCIGWQEPHGMFLHASGVRFKALPPALHHPKPSRVIQLVDGGSKLKLFIGVRGDFEGSQLWESSAACL